MKLEKLRLHFSSIVKSWFGIVKSESQKVKVSRVSNFGRTFTFQAHFLLSNLEKLGPTSQDWIVKSELEKWKSCQNWKRARLSLFDFHFLLCQISFLLCLKSEVAAFQASLFTTYNVRPKKWKSKSLKSESLVENHRTIVSMAGALHRRASQSTHGASHSSTRD